MGALLRSLCLPRRGRGSAVVDEGPAPPVEVEARANLRRPKQERHSFASRTLVALGRLITPKTFAFAFPPPFPRDVPILEIFLSLFLMTISMYHDCPEFTRSRILGGFLFSWITRPVLDRRAFEVDGAASSKCQEST